MACRVRGRFGEQGLSEVIGFILLIAVIVTAFSIYLTYFVPGEGRTNEIRHMDQVKEAFFGIKMGVDALWTNDQTDTQAVTTVPMGTTGATQQGNMGILPIMQPVASSGKVTINQRTPAPETLRITSYSYLRNQTWKKTDPAISVTTTKTTRNYENPPDSLQILISGITSVGPTTTPSRAVIINGTDSRGIPWRASINVTPRITYSINYSWYTHNLCPSESSVDAIVWLGTYSWFADCLVPSYVSNYTGTDITLSVWKNNTATVSDFIIFRSINSTATAPYSVDLLDTAYGLDTSIRDTPAIDYQLFDPGGNGITATATAQYAYRLQPKYTYEVPLGAIEYQAANNYWIPQTYYYQMGGVFLAQGDGQSPEISPSLSLTADRTRPGHIVVNINAIAIDPGNTANIEGTTPIQIGTAVKSDLGSLPYADLPDNTMNVSINITSPTGDPAMIEMWKEYFTEAANSTGRIPDNEGLYTVGNTSTDAYIDIRGMYDPAKSGGSGYDTPDILLKVRAINITANILGTGGA